MQSFINLLLIYAYGMTVILQYPNLNNFGFAKVLNMVVSLSVS